MHLRVESDLAVLDPGDHIRLPQRAGPVQLPRVDSGNLLAELRKTPGRRQGQLAQVELDVEVRVVDPVRPTQAQRDRDETLTEWLGEVQTRLEHLSLIHISEPTR